MDTCAMRAAQRRAIITEVASPMYPGHVHALGGEMTEPHGGQHGTHEDPEPGDGHAHDARSAGPRRRQSATTKRGRGGKR